MFGISVRCGVNNLEAEIGTTTLRQRYEGESLALIWFKDIIHLKTDIQSDFYYEHYLSIIITSFLKILISNSYP